ncbi:FtsH protease activity modulator HflK [Inhella sp.]|uniref:FtsH protease activity modulator HflK n=1 Tax=Inhella sp. TaxID=1921806 RepID=UPI0035B0DB70
MSASLSSSLWARLMRRFGMRAQQDGPPDLDELWRDFKRKLGHLMPGGPGPQRVGGGGGTPPDMKAAGAGIGLIGGVVVLGWLGSGFFIVQEGEQAVVTTFGRYAKTVEAGFQWRGPYPFQAHTTLAVSQLRSVEVGRFEVVPATGLRDSSMLTQDENIVDIRFTVQYRLKDAKDFLFENRDPDLAVKMAAESAVREIVGRSTMNSVLYEQRDAIANDLAKNVQQQLDRLKAGVLVSSVNVGSVQPPEQVQAAFEDAVKAGQDRERAKNEGEAYANQVIPAAKGRAARLMQEAEGYKAAVIARAEGDAQRFRVVQAEYAKAPAVTRDRMYIDTMQEVFRNVSKVMVSSKGGSNLLYLPLDKLVQPGALPQPAVQAAPVQEPMASGGAPVETRARDPQRSRERDSR